MKHVIKIEFNPITRTLEIVENDFTTFEAFGILEGAKQMISRGWLNSDE